MLALALLMIWDASHGDLLLARMAGTPMGFPWRENPFLVHVMHEGARNLSWLLVIGLFVAIRWPLGLLRKLPTRDRVQLAVTVLASVLAVSAIKHFSDTSCPWDLNEFGGVAHYVSHWSWGVGDGGPGGCFPAGHASAAFAYVGGYFVLRRASARAAFIWLGVAVVAGLVLGFAQQLRGAHYMSHTLWTAWVCWVVGFAIDVAVTRRNQAPLEPAASLHASS
ncbi:membrane-associated PAP2 superfamily phosphatase [Variovorax boronicumulans]|uniref:Membrane-associated PAP2 superfamily phosphatase n=1 Tax=Variovorax boronicumulans TaxID=436515 RepID=A0AAW8D1T9_9BURK|nr:membrane-associated PAP2 superfamily phosphatase [Variovorax boronicumulans]MDQ0054268.1 membrane-associated PAP2 superfamily phosphatase [Variovorax boronicumulans]